ncbi:MAG: hypothetical protein AAF546_09050 [Verrucomicrobiota bacterium]
MTPCLAGRNSKQSHAEIAQSLGMSLPAIRVALHRLRQRYRVLLREEIAQTIADPKDIEDEIKHLITAVSQP